MNSPLTKGNLYFFTVGAVLASVLLLIVLRHPFDHDEKREHEIGEICRKTKSEKLTSPIIDCFDIKPITNGAMNNTRKEIQSYLEKNNKKNKIVDISVYVRDLSVGPWMEIKAQNDFYPASLLKIPVAATIAMMAETNPAIWDKMITIRSSDSKVHVTNYPPPEKVKEGEKYSVRELVRRMLQYSDNDALNALSENVDPDLARNVFIDLGIPEDSVNRLSTGLKIEDTVGAKDIASMFRVLYIATYLSHSDSERILEIMAKSTFKDGLRSGVPNEVTVAHKFGEYTEPDEGDVQLHDCGIVYKPNSPYVICVMTRGMEYAASARTIADISKIVYDHFVSSQPK